MMKLIPERFKHNGLFINLFLLAFVIIITVSVTITWTTIRMSERFFIKKFSITNTKVMNQIKESFESFHYSIVIASDKLAQSSTIKKMLTEEQTNAEKMDSFFMISQQMKYIQSNLDLYDMSVFVIGKNKVIYTTDRTYWPISDKELTMSKIKQNTLKQPKKLLYQYDHLTKSRGRAEGNYIVASKALMDRLSGQVYGSMYFTIPENDFRKFYLSYTNIGNNVFLINQSGVIVSSNQTGQIGKKAKELIDYTKNKDFETQQYTTGKFMGKDQIILMNYLPSFDMYLFNIIDKQAAIGDVINKKAIFLLSMGIVIIALMIVFFSSRRLTNSLSRLVKEISDTSKHDFHRYVTVNGIYETRQIGDAFNSMLDELHEYVEQLVLVQKQKRHAELAALQQQINPHFLYNTLTSIKFMVQQGGKEETEATINALISLLQNTIGNVNETITVRGELENLKNYVFINQKRYGDRIKVQYFVTPDCLDYQIPKLILQPFIENSFFHGFNQKQQGTIHVLIWKEDNQLVCEVADNGDGMEGPFDSELPRTRRKQELFSGIGVKNVHERIQLIYGEQYGVTISSVVGEGTKIRINMPINSL